jgi:hypothetical protein
MASKEAAQERVNDLIVEGAPAEAIVAAAMDAVPAPGECRIRDGKHDSGDYPELRPVLTDDGLIWCCTYGHCTQVIAKRAGGGRS